MNTEIITKAAKAKSAEELIEIAKENDLELSVKEAETLFEKLNQPSGELSDVELDSAVGGCELREYFAKDTRFDITHVIGDGLGEIKDAGRYDRRPRKIAE